MKQPVEKLQEVSIDALDGTSEVIIVDDDPVFTFMLQDYLLTSGELRSEIFDNGTKFLDNYKSNDVRKIILDYEFSEGPDGLAVLREIKKINPMAWVIIVSGQDDLEKAVETIRMGATDYFLKTNKTVMANILCSIVKLREIEKSRLN